jgi:hypothetical protein
MKVICFLSSRQITMRIEPAMLLTNPNFTILCYNREGHQLSQELKAEMQEERQTREEERTEDDESQKSSLLSGSQKDCSRHGFLHQRMNANGSDTK